MAAVALGHHRDLVAQQEFHVTVHVRLEPGTLAERLAELAVFGGPQ